MKPVATTLVLPAPARVVVASPPVFAPPPATPVQQAQSTAPPQGARTLIVAATSVRDSEPSPKAPTTTRFLAVGFLTLVVLGVAFGRRARHESALAVDLPPPPVDIMGAQSVAVPMVVSSAAPTTHSLARPADDASLGPLASATPSPAVAPVASAANGSGPPPPPALPRPAQASAARLTPPMRPAPAPIRSASNPLNAGRF
jgi:hypothetical protein